MTTAIKAEWLDRNTNKLPYFTLAGSDDIYRGVCKHLQVAYPAAYLPNKDTGACVHFYENEDNKSVCVVAMDILANLHRDQVEVLAMLVHEAAHIVEEFFDGIGEKKPASEQRAYAMQYVSQELFIEYRRQKEALTKRAALKR